MSKVNFVHPPPPFPPRAARPPSASSPNPSPFTAASRRAFMILFVSGSIHQVKTWRRSFDVPPPPIERSSKLWPGNNPRYNFLLKDGESQVPLHESLKDVMKRSSAYWEQVRRKNVFFLYCCTAVLLLVRYCCYGSL